MKRFAALVGVLLATNALAIEDCNSVCSDIAAKMQKTCDAKPDPDEPSNPKVEAKSKAKCQQNVKDLKARCIDECTKEAAGE